MNFFLFIWVFCLRQRVYSLMGHIRTYICFLFSFLWSLKKSSEQFYENHYETNWINLKILLLSHLFLLVFKIILPHSHKEKKKWCPHDNLQNAPQICNWHKGHHKSSLVVVIATVPVKIKALNFVLILELIKLLCKAFMCCTLLIQRSILYTNCF